jgi:hypothetical protein
VAAEISALTGSISAGADPLGIASELNSLSSVLASHTHPADAVTAQQAAVTVLTGMTPTDTEQATYRRAVADYTFNLAVRLWENQRDPEALTAAQAAITAYQQAATTGADLLGIASELNSLSSVLASHTHPAEAIGAAEQAVFTCRVAGDVAGFTTSLTNLSNLFAANPGLRVMAVTLSAPDASALAAVATTRGLMVVDGTRQDSDGSVSAAGYASNEVVSQLQGQGITVTVDFDATAQWLARTDGVAIENVFADGSIPAGIGVLLGGENV